MDHLPRSHVTNLIVCKKQLACSNAAMASAAAQAIAVATAVSGDSLRWAPCDSTDFKGTPARTLFISGLKSRVIKLPFLSLKMMVKSGLEFILKLTEPLQSCCCPVQKYLPRLAELAWQLSRYLWRGSVNFKINSRPLFTIIFKLKNVNFKSRGGRLETDFIKVSKFQFLF